HFDGLFTCEETAEGTCVRHREAVSLRPPLAWVVEPLLRDWLARDTALEMARMKALLGRSMATPVIDMWAPVLPVPEIMAHIAEHFPDAMLRYLRVFWKQRPSQAALRAGAPAMARPLSEVVAPPDAAGITRTLAT